MPRTLTAILKDADKTQNSYYQLRHLLIELNETAYYLTHAELSYGKEHIQGYIDGINERHERARCAFKNED